MIVGIINVISRFIGDKGGSLAENPLSKSQWMDDIIFFLIRIFEEFNLLMMMLLSFS